MSINKANCNYFIDTHCHLDFPDLLPNISDILQRAKASNIQKMISICVKITDFPKILNLANRYEEIYCAIGTHPNNAKDEAEISLDYILQQCSENFVVAIGETGLDYYRSSDDIEIQKLCFLKHIKAAQITGLPLIIHTRNADEDMIEILTEQIKIQKFNFLLHCYSSGLKLAETAINLGGYISFSGILTFKNAQEVQKIAKTLPLNKILLETDAPYLAPVPYRGKVNEPSYMIETAKILAKLKNLNLEQIMQETTFNALNLFSKLR